MIGTGEYHIPAGVNVALLIYGMHRNSMIYSEPDDYKPERFLPENSEGRHSYSFVPFSAGPRNCIGQKYAMLEIKVVLSTLLRRFQFSVADASQPMMVPTSEVVLKPRSGVNLIVANRSQTHHAQMNPES